VRRVHRGHSGILPVKIRRWIWIRGYKDRRRAEADLTAVGIDPRSGEWDFALDIHGWRGSFEPLDDRVSALRDRAGRSHVKALVTESAEYTDGEIRAAELLEFQTRVESAGETGPDDGNEYDYSEACSLCLSGAKLVPPFRIAERDLPKRRSIAETHAGELLVTGEPSGELQRLSGSDQWLVPVEDPKTGRRLPWLAVSPRATMPRLHPSTRGLKHETESTRECDNTCPRCRRDCHGPKLTEALVLAYSREDVARALAEQSIPADSLPDVASTWELMGPGTRPGISAKRQIAQPYVLLSQRASRALIDHVAKWVRLAPVALIP